MSELVNPWAHTGSDFGGAKGAVVTPEQMSWIDGLFRGQEAAAMSELVERVARALMTHDARRDCWDYQNEGVRERYRLSARAAILAMRELTERMVDAALVSSDSHVEADDGRMVPCARPADFWRAMVDAALAEGS